MRKYHLLLKLFIIALLGLNLQACGSVQQMVQGTPTFTPTTTATPTHTFTSTPTLTPTQTPTPTSTPNLAATQKYESFQSSLEKFASDGIIPSLEGEYHSLDDYSKSLAKSGYFNWATYDEFKPTNFIIQAKVKIANATTENVFKSGCGFVFEDVFSNHALFFALDGNANYRTGGRDRGSKYVDATLFQNPEGVRLTVILYNKSLLFYVNDQKAITQTVYGGPFSVGPSILSGTSEGFGTRCDFTEVALWEMD